jgi:hypothetical protein
VFISYRREDSAGHVLALLPALRAHYGAKRVFKDTDNIPAGADFREFIKHELASCSVLLAIIGRDWLTVEDARLKRRRLDNPEDVLRVEIAIALENERIRVIPVLVERATVPVAEDLPPDLRPLAYRNALELSDSRWDSDVDRLIHAIDESLTAADGDTVDDPRDILAPSITTAAGSVSSSGSMPATTTATRPAWRRFGTSSRILRVAAAGTIVASTSVSLMYYGQVWRPGAFGASEEPSGTPPPAINAAPPTESASSNRPADTPDATRTPSPGDTLKAQLEQHRDSAHDLMRRGRRPQALDAVVAGLALDPSDADLLELRDTMLSAARRATGTAKSRARSARADTIVPELFGQALGLEEEADHNRSANTAAAIRSYWRAAERFEYAATRAAAKPAAPAPPPAIDKPAPSLPTGPVPQRDDRARIQDLITRYERGYDDMNVAAIRAVYAGVPDYLQREFDKYKEYGLTIICAEEVKLAPDGTTATRKCTFYHVMQPRDIATKIPETRARQEFVFQKRDGEWTIAALRRW